jgi:hypothetical protein
MLFLQFGCSIWRNLELTVKCRYVFLHISLGTVYGAVRAVNWKPVWKRRFDWRPPLYCLHVKWIFWNWCCTGVGGGGGVRLPQMYFRIFGVLSCSGNCRHLKCRNVVRMTHWCLRLFVPEVMLLCLLCKQRRCPSQSCVMSVLQTRLNAQNTKDILPFHIHALQCVPYGFMEAILIKTHQSVAFINILVWKHANSTFLSPGIF